MRRIVWRTSLSVAFVLGSLLAPVSVQATHLPNCTIFGTTGNDTLNGDNSCDDYMYAKSGFDTVWGHAGDDQLYGESGNDDLFGGDGFDYLAGGLGNDDHNGGGGDDTIYMLVSGAGDGWYDWAECGPGYDTVHAKWGEDNPSDFTCENVIWY